MIRHLMLAGAGVLFIIVSASAQVEDLRLKYGAKTLEAAGHIDEGIRLAGAKKHPEALKAIQAALAVEPKCQMAVFWKGLLQCDMGDMDAGIAAFAEAFALNTWSNVAIECAINAGLTHAKLDHLLEAKRWLTKAVVADPLDRHKLQWKAYRNLAITHGQERNYLAATLAAITARSLNPAQVEEKLIVELMAKAEAAPGSGRVLWLEEAAPEVNLKSAARPAVTTMPDVTSAQVAKGLGRISGLLPDSRGKFVAALIDSKQAYFWLIALGKEQTARKVELADGQIIDAAVVEDSIFLALDNPAGVREIRLDNGQVMHNWPVEAAPQSLAVYPGGRRVYVTIKNRVHAINMVSGAVEQTQVNGTYLTADPQERYLYCNIDRVDNLGGGGMETLIIGGRPVMIQRQNEYRVTRFSTCYLVAQNKLVMAEYCEKNAGFVSASPDGDWLTLRAGGNVVQLFSRGNLSAPATTVKREGGRDTPRINPVTRQLAMADAKGLGVYDLGAPDTAFTIPGVWSAYAWSGDGRYLIAVPNRDGQGVRPAAFRKPGMPAPPVAADDRELVIFSNSLTEAEQASSGEWVKMVRARRPTPTSGPDSPSMGQPLAGLDKFQLTSDRAAVQTALTRAISQGRITNPVPWDAHVPYMTQPDGGVKAVSEIFAAVREKDGGLAIYKARQLLGKSADYPPGLYALARALDISGQGEEAIRNYQKAIQADAGRTSVAPQALASLSSLLLGSKREAEALYCLATALQLDRDSAQLRARAVPLMTKLGFDGEAKTLSAGLPAGFEKGVAQGLPKLPTTQPGRVLTAKDIYRQAADAIVMVQVPGGSGTGFCVAQAGLILTNEHVVHGNKQVKVTAFRFEQGKLVQMPAVTAQVVYSDPDTDLAVLRMATPPANMRVLAVVAADPGPGDKVYAIGNPGMGDRVLEQTISEGIISAERRVIDRQPYLQHTAAVNPGNSGGPLLDDRGQIVGMVTLKARLEGVSFAIPASKIREVFQSAAATLPK